MTLVVSCIIKDCGNKPKARGWCAKHYKRWLSYGDPLVEGKQGPRPVIKFEILDLLQIDGAWWTIPLIAERLRVKPNTVQKALYDLSHAGSVRRRKIGDRGTDRPEWKAI